MAAILSRPEFISHKNILFYLNRQCKWMSHLVYVVWIYDYLSLKWRNNERHCHSNHRRRDFCSTICSRAHQRKHWNPALLAFVRGNPPVNSGFPTQRASNAENVYMLWHLHATTHFEKTHCEKMVIPWPARIMVYTILIIKLLWSFPLLCESYYILVANYILVFLLGLHTHNGISCYAGLTILWPFRDIL